MKKYLLLPSLFAAMLFVASCGDDDPITPTGPQPTGQSETYTLSSVSDENISGSAKFIEIDDNSITVEVTLTGTTTGDSHPAHIHLNTAVEGGGIARSLNDIDGATGISSTNFTKLNDSTAISYTDLINFDGYINVHKSDSELNVLFSQGDIGANELTGTKESYALAEATSSGISGTVEFAERKNGTALVTIAVSGTTSGVDHNAHIHAGSTLDAGGVTQALNKVIGDTGESKSHVDGFNNGNSADTYTDLIAYNGHVNVHNADGSIAAAQGNIGTAIDALNFDVSNDGSSAYVFNGGGFTDASNPALTLTKGTTYTFTVNASGHPFFIKTVQGTGTGDAYSNGVSNNGTDNGVVTFTVPSDAPSLFYNCEFHAPMTNTITAVD